MTKTLPTGNSQRDRVAGFTLIELLVVLTIVSVVASSISYLVFDRKDSFKSITQEIVQNLRLVRQQSIRDDKRYQVKIDLGKNSLHFIDTVVELSEDISLTITTSEDQVIDSDVVGMTFFPDASSSGGVIKLETDHEMAEISVIWISGKIQTRFQHEAG